MRIQCIEVLNFRRLKSTHIDFDKETTIFVGANNSGKTSAMTALHYFLVKPKSLALRDITIANWAQIDGIGQAWEVNQIPTQSLDALLPSLDMWLDVPVTEIRHVLHILPTLDWRGGNLGVRLHYRVTDIEWLKADYLLQRKASNTASEQAPRSDGHQLKMWPLSLTDYLARELPRHIELQAFRLNPASKQNPEKGIAKPQPLPAEALPLGKNPFEGLIKIDEIAAQRDFADAGKGSDDEGDDSQPRRYKRRLSEQLRTYYDRHLDPTKTPDAKDYAALSAMQIAEQNFDARLEEGFEPALKELESIGYPGIANPKLKISTQLRAIDGLRHGSALQYEVTDPGEDGSPALKLPEDYAGLGYQNLIAMVFMLMAYRDNWMRVGKVTTDLEREKDRIPPLHLVLIEEPEAHLHAQVQQVFIKNAYQLLRNHDDLRDKETYSTQLIVSTHSSHVAHEVDFANLRYFRRRAATKPLETSTTTVTNLSQVFGDEDDTKRFVKRYLKATHCDLFFADGIIFVEGQAERLLIPHFIRNQFPTLSRRYITLIELGGSHAHKFAPLVDELGITTLVIADLDAVSLQKINDKNGKPRTVRKSVRPECGKDQLTANSVLRKWHPKKNLIDDLAALDENAHLCNNFADYVLYIAYQKPIQIDGRSVIPRTFEDALIFENRDTLRNIKGSPTSRKIRNIIDRGLSAEVLADELFRFLESAEKGAFSLDCLMLEDPKALKAPTYIHNGLTWFENTLSTPSTDYAPKVSTT
ncbi:MAG TPA: AAA family ATPase [Gallionella sp.]|nr:AAA family ATPase [Gallionella sp.]